MVDSTRFCWMRKVQALCCQDSRVLIWEACFDTDMEVWELQEVPAGDRNQVVLELDMELVDREDLDEWVAAFVEVDSGYLVRTVHLEPPRDHLRPDNWQTCKHPFSYRNQEE